LTGSEKKMGYLSERSPNFTPCYLIPVLMNLRSVFRTLLPLMIILVQGCLFPGKAQDLKDIAEPETFRGDYAMKGDQFAIWNGSHYVPVFIKGINLGISLPGTLPGQLAATAEDYRRWFSLVKEAGYNTIRLYTLHFPRFYQELSAYNLQHPQNPLLVIQGVWLEENGTSSDLYDLTAGFDQEIGEVVAAVHGDVTLAARPGKAYGDYNTDISPWVIGYLAGREIFPSEVKATNEAHTGDSSYEGLFFQLRVGDPTEVWMTRRLDSLQQYEFGNYGMVRPTGFATWPTLDPLFHPTEHILVGSSEDLEQIDLADLVCTETSAGFFVGYHAYPYYPDFIIQDPYYLAESDAWGPNNYLGYLKDLKAHYADTPLLIAEFGVPSSWGSGHHSPSGMHHGGLSEEEQGEYTLRMFDNIEESGCSGGVQFSLIDEWFKQTWITNPYSDQLYRHLWHNLTSPEQNFGILSYAPPPAPYTWTGIYPGQPVSGIQMHADYTFFRVRVHMQPGTYPEDTLWMALDTYQQGLGESLLPGGQSIGVTPDTLRAEFLLQVPLQGDRADLLVIPDYDIYGIKELDRLDTVVSVHSDLGLWNPVRWKTNYFYNTTQYVGELHSTSSADPYEFMNAVTRYHDSVEVRIPWTLLNFTAPTQRRAMHYLSHMEGPDLVIDNRDTLSDGIALSLVLRGQVYQTARYSWSPWGGQEIIDAPPIERKKQSFHLLKQGLVQYNSPPVGRADTFFLLPGTILEADPEEGLLRNDFDLDGNDMQVQLSSGSGTRHGGLYLHTDGSFRYEPDPGFRGEDFFMYYLEDGTTSSALIPVLLQVNYPLSAGDRDWAPGTSVFPNPGKERFCVRISGNFGEADLRVTDVLGREILHRPVEEAVTWVELPDCQPGIYLFILTVDKYQEFHRIIIE
jgi:hypothetical protein